MATIPTQPIIPKVSRTAKGSFGSMNNNDLFFIDLDTSEYLGLQGMPTVLNYGPDSKFTVINSPGSNNPLYMFSNSEDILEFEISWFTDDPSRLDVISRCKWLEVMSKADGYNGRPHYCKFKWGRLFSDSTWIVVSAKYTLANFDKNFGYLPTSAIQTVGLRRVVQSNPTHNQIAAPTW